MSQIQYAWSLNLIINTEFWVINTFSISSPVCSQNWPDVRWTSFLPEACEPPGFVVLNYKQEINSINRDVRTVKKHYYTYTAPKAILIIVCTIYLIFNALLMTKQQLAHRLLSHFCLYRIFTLEYQMFFILALGLFL